MIAEMLILVPLAFKKGGGNDVGSTYGVTQTEGSTANLGAGNWFKLGKIETIPQSFELPIDYTTATDLYLEGKTGVSESMHNKLKGGRL